MEINIEYLKSQHNKLLNQSFLLELLNSIVDNFYFNEINKRKICYLYICDNPKVTYLVDRIDNIEMLISNIRKNLNCGNYKRSFHMIIILKKGTKQISDEIQVINI